MRVVIGAGFRFDVDEVTRLVEAGFEDVDTTGVEVWVERMRRARDSFTGRAYPEPAYKRQHPDTKFLVRLRLPSVFRRVGYPITYRYVNRKTAPWITVHDWRERLLTLAAHEACHIRQFRERLRRSEVQAERWSQEILERWRAAGAPAAAEAAEPLVTPAPVAAFRGRRRGRGERPERAAGLQLALPGFD